MPTVLIVEDDLPIADLLQEALEAQDFTVIGIARTVEQAIGTADRERPDFAVIDLHLAHGELGTDVAAHLRKITKVGILFSTGNDDRRLTASIGDAVMTKPYRLDDVGRGLRILSEIAETGHSASRLPRNFRLLATVAA
jgi:DNA-binding response OmpR family regulator